MERGRIMDKGNSSRGEDNKKKNKAGFHRGGDNKRDFHRGEERRISASDKKVYLRGFCKGFIQAALLLGLFYRSMGAVVIGGGIFGFLNLFFEKKRYRKQQEYEITLQFRSGLQGISSALSAGYSIENSLTEARRDLVLLYGQEALLVREFLWIERQLALNQPLENLLFAFGSRWNTEDILHFAQVFQTAKRSGGDLIAITRRTAEKISEKIEVKREIHTMIAGKRLEGKVMCVIPLGIIVYFWICSPGFLDCLYTPSGRPVMTVLLLLYGAAYYWCGRLCDIEV